MLSHVGAFCIMFVLDVVFALYTGAVVNHAAVAASLWAAMIQLCNGALVLSFVKEGKTILSAMAGAFAGTLVSVTLLM